MNIKQAIKKFIGVGVSNESARIAWIEAYPHQFPSGLKLLDEGGWYRRVNPLPNANSSPAMLSK